MYGLVCCPRIGSGAEIITNTIYTVVPEYFPTSTSFVTPIRGRILEHAALPPPATVGTFVLSREELTVCFRRRSAWKWSYTSLGARCVPFCTNNIPNNRGGLEHARHRPCVTTRLATGTPETPPFRPTFLLSLKHRFLHAVTLGEISQVESELLGAVSYLLQHGAKPGALDLIRLSTIVPFPRLKVGSTLPR